MAKEIGYVFINPYSLRKSRTGGIISRLLARTQLELIGARMFAPSKKMIDEYVEAIREVITDKKHKAKVRELFVKYLYENYAPDKVTGERKRVMCLLFKGDEAVEKLKNVVGAVSTDSGGETIRETYGDYIQDVDGNIKYFEPAVVTGVSISETKKQLEILAKYSDKEGGLLEDVVSYRKMEKVQKTLVLIKPDNFRFPSGRPGNIIDSFSRTGLFIIGAKVLQMSVSQAEEFYGPVKEVLREKLKFMVRNKVENSLNDAFPFDIPSKLVDSITEKLKGLNAETSFNQIVNFMTGYDLTKSISAKEKKARGKVKCLALCYQGYNAIEKIRDQLGSTDPSKAAVSTVRKEFGQNVMENTAHASDSPKNALREMKIIGIKENYFKKVIKEYL
ncbi:MAG: nucleoside-diphosphate kinase [Candidatus Aureabacteria bacterium]|nr:nucleoside-diphosphate kinase [Candidatus Auribacterota bacterium]